MALSVLKNLSRQSLIGVPPPPPRFTIDEWNLNNRQRYRVVNDQHQLADSVLDESERITDKADELAIRHKEQTDFRIKERLADIDFIKKEITSIRKKVIEEGDAYILYKERIIDCMKSVDENALRIVKKCILLREHRLGIDLVHDDVERELLKEIETIEGVQAILRRSLEQTHEQMRRIKAQFYAIDRDLEDKENAYKLDYHNSGLNPQSLQLSLYHGRAPLNPSTIKYQEWSSFTHNNLASVSKELNSCTPLRSYIDTLIRQCIEDLRTQRDVTNAAFYRRINETKEAKTKLEIQHAETARMANEMTRNIARLQTALSDKEKYLALAHTRLGNRAQRSGIELCRDHVESQLCEEVVVLRESLKEIQQMLLETQASLRYLMRCQIQLEEDINIKTNTLKIDEVDCMTLREAMDYHAY